MSASGLGIRRRADGPAPVDVEFGAVGSMKNKSFNPILFVKDQKTGRRKQQVGKLPPFLDSIKPIAPGKLYRVLP